MLSVVETFLELGDATSHNLEYSHQENVHVSYGEETITESNLLEIRRRNHNIVQLQTFTKHKESKVGADWEWHIVGRLFTFKMRVQAKRIRSDGKLIIKHYVKSQGEEQKTLLLDGARSEGMRPAYCFYCTDKQRKKWKQKIPALGLEHYRYGCLIADARKISLETKGLKDVEDECIPWHFLFQETEFAKPKSLYIPLAADVVAEFRSWVPSRARSIRVDDGRPRDTAWRGPTVSDLNGDRDREFQSDGVQETDPEDRARLSEDAEERNQQREKDRRRLEELGVSRLMVIDVRNESGLGEGESWRGR